MGLLVTYLYEIGPENARTEIYIKEDGGTFIKVECRIFDNNGNRAAVCANIFRLDDGNTMSFFSGLDQLDAIPDIEAGMCKLMATFRVSP